MGIYEKMVNIYKEIVLMAGDQLREVRLEAIQVGKSSEVPEHSLDVITQIPQEETKHELAAGSTHMALEQEIHSFFAQLDEKNKCKILENNLCKRYAQGESPNSARLEELLKNMLQGLKEHRIDELGTYGTEVTELKRTQMKIDDIAEKNKLKKTKRMLDQQFIKQMTQFEKPSEFEHRLRQFSTQLHELADQLEQEKSRRQIAVDAKTTLETDYMQSCASIRNELKDNTSMPSEARSNLTQEA